jgi:predicted nucleic acid-binding protein
MVLADTSVWVHHFRSGDEPLARLLEQGEVAMHESVLGELACGNLRNREKTLEELGRLRKVRAAEATEVLHLIEQHRLHRLGLGWVEAHLLASARLDHAMLYTLDRELANVAAKLGVGFFT